MSAGVTGTAGTTENLYVSSTKEKAAAEAAEKAGNKQKVSHDDFLNLLMAQMTHQDPLNPMDDTQFLGQMAQLQALDEQMALTTTMAQMRIDTQLASASNLIGMKVGGYDPYNNFIEGMAVEASNDDGDIEILLDSGKRLSIERVSEVRAPSVEDLG